VAIAERGLKDAVREDPALARGVNVFGGSVTNQAVAQAHDLETVPLSSVIAGASD